MSTAQPALPPDPDARHTPTPQTGSLHPDGRRPHLTRGRPGGADAPPHQRLRLLLLVAMGGTIGTAAREWLSMVFPFSRNDFGWTTFGINLCGALLLGLLLELLGRRGADTGGRRTARLFAGTGVLGGFTTYSALATDSAYLISHRPVVGLGYAIGTVAGGLLAAALGIWAGRLRLPRRRQSQRRSESA
ncbi:fluoride efflux transporter FluC [Nakamurella aerolata]|uniref:Fluoride-specific ion channel FluC n=1 Tax=Nakamurella aerolata TaxID=1656892 RepID=A0A849A9E9_9ACTN|nr:CrcB family protein [Nakamurella aerolata]NNG35711.1 CrcB family protein [Nakamurella aerolata]